jgi:hypothetical protein
MRFLALAVAVAATTALAGDAPDDCSVTPGPNDVVKKRGDIVIAAGRTVEDVIALHGSVTLKAGASVKTAIALRGDVVVEAGATVRDNAIAVRGTVKRDPGSRVKGVIELTSAGVRIVGEDGEVMEFHASVNGTSLGKVIATAALAKVKTCRVVEQD